MTSVPLLKPFIFIKDVFFGALFIMVFSHTEKENGKNTDKAPRITELITLGFPTEIASLSALS